jgi:hypothetical protein
MYAKEQNFLEFERAQGAAGRSKADGHSENSSHSLARKEQVQVRAPSLHGIPAIHH